MAFRWKKWWAAGLALSCGCAIEPKRVETPESHVEARGQASDGWEKIEQTSFNAQAPVQAPVQAPELLPPPLPLKDDAIVTNAAGLQVPELKPLPINLPTALRLMNARAWDIGIAAEGVRLANAQLLGANALWLPTIIMGADYQHHDGPIQSTDGTTANSSHSNFSVGGAPEAVFSISDAIFEPLAVRQLEQARRQQLQAATNDTTLSVAQAYFNVQQARGNLAGAKDTIRRTDEMLRVITGIAPDLVPIVEVSRARAQLFQFQQSAESASERWNVASADLVRLLRMNPSTVVEPVEQPHMRITLIAPEEPVDRLLSLALVARPELAATQNLAQSAEERWREERFRPLIPNLYLRGNSTQLPDSMAFTAYSAGQGGSLGRFGLRDDFELQAMWELRNMGLGNLAAIRGRRAELETSRMQAYRAQDIVAQEVVSAAAQVRSAASRVKQAERELKEAIQSANDNLVGLSQTKQIGGKIFIVVIRPQEAMASVQALLQAYYDYYGTVADYNRSEFALYRALGNPAQALVDSNGHLVGADGNCLPYPAAQPDCMTAPPLAQPVVPVVPVVPLAPDALKSGEGARSLPPASPR